jgi:dephospho-CoA kinase
MRIIGVVGQNGSGKDEVLKYLRTKHNIPFLSTGDMVREIAKKEGLETTRENLKVISERCFCELGEGCFVRLVAGKIRSSGWQTAGISGIRSINDVRIMREICGTDFILIDVYVSDSHQRYSRMVNRGEERDPKSYEQFMKQDKAEEELFHISDAEKLANYHISNDGTLADMHNAIEKLISDNGLLGDSFRQPASGR